ncbi:hypothetical protein [Rhodoferax sp.]|uniref:hypothetical protein n=1 Tax=Rhodoferax sp. TaxID=50421 RepID=UPI0027352D48|nr:hypothetical protein [Rhodoferax sp.]MDP3193200.1 hypothetical protein [Rhodoferax sp.]MDP3865250.1 hypothetical protein [Rhodoferax sp.]
MKIIKYAIKNKQMLVLVYKGLPRIIEPHIVGSATNGNEYVRGFQTGGTSSTNDYGWKIMNLKQIQLVSLLPNQFFSKARSEFIKNDSVIKNVYATL